MLGSKKKGAKNASNDATKLAWDLGGTCPTGYTNFGGIPVPDVPALFHLASFSTKVAAFSRAEAGDKGVGVTARVEELYLLAVVYVASYMRTVEKTKRSKFAEVHWNLMNVFVAVIQPMAALVDAGVKPPKIGTECLPPSIRDLASPKLVMNDIIDYLNGFAQ